MSELSQRIDEVRQRIAHAARAAGRLPEEITLVAVSKTHPAEAVREAWLAGQGVFGENKVQELLAKAPDVPSGVVWHFLGHLQTNKIRKLLPACELVHGIDSFDLALQVDRISTEVGAFPRVLLEVNVSGEGSKFGFQPEAIERELDALLDLPRVHVEGFMTLAPLAAEAEASRPYFARLRELRDRLAARTGLPLPTLSMGMSGDYEVAIQEGATIVRVGTAIFGARPRPR